jgi:hypothetical protein
MEAPLVLATIAQRFRIEPLGTPAPLIGVALGFKEPVAAHVSTL